MAAPEAAAGIWREEEKDFIVSYDESQKKWSVQLKWCGDEPGQLFNKAEEYSIPSEARQEYERQLTKWVTNGWLVPYDERVHGQAKGTIPLMAVIQPNKDKVRPVMDFRELNEYLDSHTAAADVCSEKIREWRRFGRNVSLLDLKDAYLQVHVSKSLWPYQTVVFQGKRWCLTRLGFGIGCAPLVMKKVLSMALGLDQRIDSATSSYVDDIFVNEEVATAAEVKAHLENHGLDCKAPESVIDGARVLGLRVWGERDGLFWRRDRTDISPPPKLTRRAVFSLCGRLTSLVPVAGWLRVAASYLKRRVTAVSSGWDDEVTDPELCAMVIEMVERVNTSDPARGRWDVSGDGGGVVWVDASSLAIGAVLEINDCVVEDACWLRKSSDTHINLAELDAVIRGLNLALSWNLKNVTIMTDSRTVYHWLSDVLSGRARVKTKAASEMLIRRRLETVKKLGEEYAMQLCVKFVPSAENRADALTRVPKKWLTPQGASMVCSAVVTKPDIARIHHTSGHPGITRTLRLCRRQSSDVTRAQVRAVIRQCQACQSVDPAPQRWVRGTLGVNECWERVSMDVCHADNQLYLTLVDCGPSRYAIWRRLKRQDAESVIAQLESIFLERGAPTELLTDNYPSFRSAVFNEFVSRWGVSVRYRAAHVPSGNGISERNHRSIKTLAARKKCSVVEAVYRYNVMPRAEDQSSSPMETLFNYRVKVPDVDTPADADISRFTVGDKVWVRDPSRRCDVASSLGTVSRIVSVQCVEVDGVPRHVRDLRLAVLPQPAEGRSPPISESDDEGAPIIFYEQRVTPDAAARGESEGASHDGEESAAARRSTRERRPATLTQYGDL
ncbi:uncharacterized protein LOC122374015 [Amphibalanus amphitrite]|uniref:uncharacterized protein LOC122374015 n=1 Tax=Amphibalanus amphitrite TaxID=1232801 RepID=UPI001C901BBB|nr:uncharacterized protein LOC122374015 [Amphibalanus amphitrite]